MLQSGQAGMWSLQESRSEAQGPQEWETFEDIPLSMQPSPIIRILNVPGKPTLPGTQVPPLSWSPVWSPPGGRIIAYALPLHALLYAAMPCWETMSYSLSFKFPLQVNFKRLRVRALLLQGLKQAPARRG